MNPYQRLANAIVMQAADDWRKAVEKLKMDPDDPVHIHMKEDAERFFRSQWLRALTDADGNYILQMLNEEVRNNG